MGMIKFTEDFVNASHGRYPGIEPGSKRVDRPVAIRVLENPVLELFSKAHWVTPIVWFGPPMVYSLYVSLRSPRTAGWMTAVLFALGWLMWTLIEYCLHRFLFHMKATTETEKLRAFMIHGYHHDFPDDPKHLVAPPVMSWVPAIIIAGVYYMVFGPVFFWPVFAGSAAGYVSYDWTHYYTHHARPSWPLGKFLRRYHMKHHFKDGNAWFGVSNPLWDYVFRTHRSTLQADGETGSAVAEQGTH